MEPKHFSEQHIAELAASVHTDAYVTTCRHGYPVVCIPSSSPVNPLICPIVLAQNEKFSPVGDSCVYA